MTPCSRDIACIYYLAKDWTAQDGGVLLDKGPSSAGDEMQPRPFVPEFNSAVFFRVPRLHAVTAVTTKTKLRYSIFGWIYNEGVKY